MRLLDSGAFPTLRPGDVFLAPGELYSGPGAKRVWTILGSCVSIVMWHGPSRFGAMSHFLLPERPVTAPRAGNELDARYGVDSCALMLAALSRAGVAPAQCRAALYGGSRALIGCCTEQRDIGHRNADVARAFLERHGVPVVRASLHGTAHRRVCFDVETGRTWEESTERDA